MYDEAGGPSSPLLEEQYSGGTTSVTAAYGWGADGLRARYQGGSLYNLYQYDPLGSYLQRTQTNTYPTNLVTDTGPFEAWGQPLTDKSSTGATLNRHDAVGFQGQPGTYTDLETSLVLMGHRYYDPGTGRFVTRDPIGYGGGANLYGFAGNNPVNDSDPDGMRPLNATDLGRFAKLRAAATGSNPSLRTKDVKLLIEGAISEISSQIATVKGSSPANDPDRLKALWWANDHLGDVGYGAGSSLPTSSGFAGLGLAGESKCNVFIADAYGDVVGFGDLHGVPLYGNWFARHPASANELGDKSESVPHFGVVTSPLPGDIAAFGEPGGGLSHGHSALVLGNSVLIYAGGPAVKIGSLAFNQPGHNPVVYRRYKY